MSISKKMELYVEPSTAQRLKIYAAASNTSMTRLAENIINSWLDQQPLVGGKNELVGFRRA